MGTDNWTLSRRGTIRIAGLLGASFLGGCGYLAGKPTRGNGWQVVATFTDPESNTYTGFGVSVTLDADGTTAGIGAPGNDTGGAASMFARRSAGWGQPSTLRNPDPERTAELGVSLEVSSDGTTVIVGAHGDPAGQTSTPGTAYIFTQTADGWTHAATLPHPDPDPGDLFGAAVTLSADGETALVGALFDAVDGTRHAGSVYVFARDETDWEHVDTLGRESDDLEGETLGASVALDGPGSVAVVGAPGANGHGQTYVFTEGTEGWTHTDTLTGPPDPYAERIGASVALSNDGRTAVVGSPDYGEIEGNFSNIHRKHQIGRVYVYTRGQTGWERTGVLANPAPNPNELFGDAVTISGDGQTVGCGTPFDDVQGLSSAGSVAVFTRRSTGWKHTAKLTSPDPSERGEFGKSVALDAEGSAALIGSSNPSTDIAYIFGRG